MDEMIIFWLVVMIVAIVVEVLTMGLTTIWFAGGALVAVIAAALDLRVWIQIALFVAVSLLLLFFTRPAAVRFFNRNRVKTNVESMVGAQAIVISEISNLHGVGQVTVGGREWSARSADDRLVIPVGCVVNVLDVQGVKLIVEPDAQMAEMLSQQENRVQEPLSVAEIEELESRQGEAFPE